MVLRVPRNYLDRVHMVVGSAVVVEEAVVCAHFFPCQLGTGAYQLNVGLLALGDASDPRREQLLLPAFLIGIGGGVSPHSLSEPDDGLSGAVVDFQHLGSLNSFRVTKRKVWDTVPA